MLGGGDVNGVTVNIEIIKLDYTEPRRGACSVPYCFFKFFRKLFMSVMWIPIRGGGRVRDGMGQGVIGT